MAKEKLEGNSRESKRIDTIAVRYGMNADGPYGGLEI